MSLLQRGIYLAMVCKKPVLLAFIGPYLSGNDNLGTHVWDGKCKEEKFTLAKTYSSGRRIVFTGEFSMNRNVMDGTWEDESCGNSGKFHVEAESNQFANVVGLQSVKAFVQELKNQLIIAGERKKLGLPNAGMGTLHMVFKVRPQTLPVNLSECIVIGEPGYWKDYRCKNYCRAASGTGNLA